MSIKYTVHWVDLEAGYLTVKIFLPDETFILVNWEICSLTASSEATELELKHALDQLVAGKVQQLFPPAPPTPVSLLNMVGGAYATASV